MKKVAMFVAILALAMTASAQETSSCLANGGLCLDFDKGCATILVAGHPASERVAAPEDCGLLLR